MEKTVPFPIPCPLPLTPVLGFLAIGHLTVDRLASGVALGGSAAYAAATAARLGLKAGILTSAADELAWESLLPGVEIVRSPSPASTSFENRYVRGRRIQRLLALAEPISPDSAPREWRGCPIVHLGPVDHEVAGSLALSFPRALVGLTPQGLLRYWNDDGIVRHGGWRGDPQLLSSCRVVVLSEDDLEGDPTFLTLCRKRVPVVLVTRGSAGAMLFEGDAEESFRAFPTEEVDPTGAGDVFAAAFLIEYNLTGDPSHSTAFASCAASFAVERPGIAGIPDRHMVERRLALYEEVPHGGAGSTGT